MEDFVRFALSEGFTSYGFSSHAPLPFSTAWTMEWDRMNDYQAEFTTPERSEAVLAKHKELDTPLIDINLKYWADGSPLSKTALLI